MLTAMKADMRPLLHTAVLLCSALLLSGVVHAADNTEKLAKETQNPVASLISVPFQNNFNFGVGPDNEMIWIMNVQPVIPIPLNEDWNLTTRTIVPIINQPGLTPGMDDAFGMGDINPSVFLSPVAEDGFIWGVGVTTTLPTATVRSAAASGAWARRPSACT